MKSITVNEILALMQQLTSIACGYSVNLKEYKDSNFTPIFDIYIPSISEHIRFEQYLMQVIFSFEDQWMKQNHEIGSCLMDAFADMFEIVRYEEMEIHKGKNRIKITNFNEQYSLS